MEHPGHPAVGQPFTPAACWEPDAGYADPSQTTQGFASFGAGGFNSPSLLGVALSGPYFHDGSAHTLEQVATRHNLGATGTIATNLSAQDLADLLAFVKSIDDETVKVPNATDTFIQ